jgi:hypothetical protein
MSVRRAARTRLEFSADGFGRDEVIQMIETLP